MIVKFYLFYCSICTEGGKVSATIAFFNEYVPSSNRPSGREGSKAPPCEQWIDKNLVFDGESIRNEKDTVKEKNRAKGKGTKGISGENGNLPVWTLQISSCY
jgi:hypothetical protein